MKHLSIIKPGIIFGNVVTLCGGYFLAVQAYGFHFFNFLAAFLGMIGVIACGCILNNCIDRDIDKLMQRTKKRLLATDNLSVKLALLYALVFGVIGFLLLYLGTNALTLLIAFIGLLAYVVTYTLWLKRSSVFGTVIGAVSGAVPPVVGYTAVTGQFNLVAFVLFLILFCWQMPHFFAIAICYSDDYASAGIPVLPLKRSMTYTKVNILIFILLFFLATLLLPILGVTHLLYLITASLVGIIWIGMGLWGFFVDDDVVWARKLFLFSIINITLLSIAMGV
jgi:protoheme IX farnesyltransferase